MGKGTFHVQLEPLLQSLRPILLCCTNDDNSKIRIADAIGMDREEQQSLVPQAAG